MKGGIFFFLWSKTGFEFGTSKFEGKQLILNSSSAHKCKMMTCISSSRSSVSASSFPPPPPPLIFLHLLLPTPAPFPGINVDSNDQAIPLEVPPPPTNNWWLATVLTLTPAAGAANSWRWQVRIIQVWPALLSMCVLPSVPFKVDFFILWREIPLNIFSHAISVVSGFPQLRIIALYCESTELKCASRHDHLQQYRPESQTFRINFGGTD